MEKEIREARAMREEWRREDEEEKKRKYQKYMESRTRAELKEYYNIHTPKGDDA